MIKRIMVTLDGSEFAERALPYAIELAQKFDAEIELIRVVQPIIVMSDFGATTYQTLVSMEEKEAATYLRARQHELQQLGVRVHYKLLEGSVADAIIDQALRDEVDLIVMSTHGRSGLSRWIYGSVATKILEHAPCPVFLVRVQHAKQKSELADTEKPVAA